MTSIPLSTSPQPASAKQLKPDEARLRETFRDFVGGTLFRELFKAMRASTGKAAFMNGGQAEKIFQQQLDELLIDQMTKARGGALSEDLFQQQFKRVRLENADGANSRTPDPSKSTFDVDL